MAPTSMEGGAKIIQIRDENNVQKRVLDDQTDLEAWLRKLSVDFEGQYTELYDDNNIQWPMFHRLNDNVVYHLKENKHKRKKRRRVDTCNEELQLKELIEFRQFDKAWAKLVEVATSFVADTAEEPDYEICNPVKIKSTWQGEEGPKHLKKLLKKQCHEIDKSIGDIVRRETKGGGSKEADYRADYRAGRVVGIRLGTGCGKSHLLLEAPKLLGMPGIYVTYNLEQSLKADKQDPKAAVLLRILLRLAQIPHAASDRILRNTFGQALLSIDGPVLRKFAVHQLAKAAGNSGIFVGVDEVMAMVNTPDVRQIISELASVATEYYKTKESSCYVFITSLKDKAFFNSSGRAVITWTPERPNEQTAEVILRQYRRGRPAEDLIPLLISSAGFHFRSMVFAARVIGEFDSPTVQSIVGKVYDRWKQRVSDSTIKRIKDFIVSECKGGVSATREVIDEVEEFLDHTGAVPPPLVCGAFGLMKKIDADHHEVDVNAPLYRLFNCEYAYTDDAKQLEQFGESYDLFRATEELLVLKRDVKIHVVPAGTKKSTAWFRGLMYPDNLTISTDSLFKTEGKSEICKLTQAGISPSKEKYYSPGKTNHPYVDRAFVAKNTDGGECFVLLQDKVNNDVPKAVHALNKAGELLKEQHPEMEVLCILNVIGAGPNTTSQQNLNFAYVLVGENELDAFYSAHFAPVARFIRKRHLMGEQKRREQATPA